MRSLVTLTVLAAFAASLGTGRAVAAGAVAVGVAPGGAAHGYAVGFRVRAADIEAAKAAALAQCKKPQPNISGTPADSGSAAAQAHCEVVATFSDKCYADAADPKDGTPGVGWAVADTQQQADDEALARCRATAGDDRREFCRVFSRACDSH
jgi:hypothetical protein